jgi:prepilin-type N-terminal cleavage/methylation domain-containing protein
MTRSCESLRLRELQRRSRRTARGYTLVEVLVSIALGLLALASFTAFNRFQLFALRNQATQIDLQLTARTVADLIAREVRRTGMDPTCAKSFEAVAKATDEELRVQSDLDGSGAIDAPDENLTYRYNFDTNSIERVSGATTDVLLDGLDLSGSKLVYFDANGNVLSPSVSTGGLNAAQRASVRRIRIELALADDASDPLSDEELAAQISTDIDLRNRFFLQSTACP